MQKLVLYSVILMLSQCNKYDDTQQAASLQVPPLTETGANTIGCLVNGYVWANFGETFVYKELGGSFQPNVVRSGFYTDTARDSTFFVSGTYTLAKKGTVLKQTSLSLNITKKGSLVGIHQLYAGDGGCDYRDVQHYAYYSGLARNPIIVNVKKDSITPGMRHVVSGTFSGMLYGTNGTPDSLSIVGGVFDTLTP